MRSRIAACIFALLVPLCAMAQTKGDTSIMVDCSDPAEAGGCWEGADLDGKCYIHNGTEFVWTDCYTTVEWKGKLILLWKDCPVKNEDGTVDESPGYDPEELGPAMIHYQYGMGCYVRTFPHVEVGLRSDGFLVLREQAAREEFGQAPGGRRESLY